MGNIELARKIEKMAQICLEQGSYKTCFREFRRNVYSGTRRSQRFSFKKGGLYKSIMKEKNDAIVGEKKKSNRLKTAGLACRLLNPLLDVSFPEEMQDKLTVFRTPEISERIVFDSIDDIKEK